MLLIDALRAKERILYERYLKALHEARPAIQENLFPQTVELDSAAFALFTQVQEKINSHRPDDNINISVVRDGKQMSFSVQLLGRETDAAVGTQGKVKVLGAIVEDASEAQLKKYDIKSGVVVVSVGEGSIMKAGIPEGFIITYVNQTKIENTQDLLSVVSGAQRSVLVEGINPSDGSVSYYAIGLNKK